jgi:DNA mismatch repair protein MSH4
VFTNVVKRKKNYECQTLDLMKMNQKIKDAHNEVVSMSDRAIQELIDRARTCFHPLFKISEAIGMLDMLAAFAHLTTIHDYTKPEIADALAIKSGRHPIREKITTGPSKHVPNDVYATEQTRFQIITGCNMSGKSTYIRSIVLTTVIAQTGCFVPAAYASFPIFTQLFSRVSTDSAVEANVSTFAAEMRDMAHILRNIEPRSLVIVDELGRGTSTTDGLAIAIAIAEELINSKAFVWFVTHFRDLPRILAERAGVVNLHLSVNFAPTAGNPAHTTMKMTYKISDGPIPSENQFYGIALAKAIDLPADVVDVATQVSEALHERSEVRKSDPRALKATRRRRLILSLREQLMQARNSSLKGRDLRKWLKNLQEEFVIRLQAIESEAEDHIGDATSTPPTTNGGGDLDFDADSTLHPAHVAANHNITTNPVKAERDPLSKGQLQQEQHGFKSRCTPPRAEDIIRIKHEYSDKLNPATEDTSKESASHWQQVGETNANAIIIDSDVET